jgi:uncharacterized membrane protein
MTSFVTSALPAFLASLVEFVEALTIVLAVGVTRGWRAAWAGTVAGALLLAALVLAFGPALGTVPLATLQLVVGIMLLFFGMRWLRKAVLRSAGVIALHDETKIYEREKARLAHAAPRGDFDWQGATTTFNAVALEGLEVVFIVIAVGATAGALVPAGIGAGAAAVVVAASGFALGAPLKNVPENALKFAVGVLLSSFGTFWTAEGLHIPWPGGDLALLGLVAGYLVASGLGVVLARGRNRPALASRVANG